METLLPNHVTIYEYAKLKKIYPPGVYRAIKNGRIIPDRVGKSEITMIDFEKYKDVEFRINPVSKNTIEDYFDYSDDTALTKIKRRNKKQKK